jgi:hypothetical protein
MVAGVEVSEKFGWGELVEGPHSGALVLVHKRAGGNGVVYLRYRTRRNRRELTFRWHKWEPIGRPVPLLGWLMPHLAGR